MHSFRFRKYSKFLMVVVGIRHVLRRHRGVPLVLGAARHVDKLQRLEENCQGEAAEGWAAPMSEGVRQCMCSNEVSSFLLPIVDEELHLYTGTHLVRVGVEQSCNLGLPLLNEPLRSLQYTAVSKRRTSIRTRLLRLDPVSARDEDTKACSRAATHSNIGLLLVAVKLIPDPLPLL